MKNRTMRIAALLLVLTLMTSCFVGGTFAKYTTKGDTGEQTARVAKWGVVVTAKTDSTFGEIYYNKDNENVINTTYTFGTDTVKSAGGNVVAPGTKGTVTGLTIEGTPEVDTLVTFAAEVTLTDWVVDSSYYCPLVFTVATTDAAGNTTVTVINGAEKTSAADLEKAIEDEVLKAAARFPAGSVINDSNLRITWEWPFETGADDVAKAANNVKDTALGDADTPAEVAIKITATVEQVD